VYIFAIDNNLREWFISVRDEAYNIISKSEIPGFPSEMERKGCRSCKCKTYCVGDGLELDNNENQ
jgi:CRISPR/Cas system-associated exonuclease Cas4 (RecB family)